MDDKQKLIELCEKLGLTRIDSSDENKLPSQEEYVVLDNKIVIGWGEGYTEFFVEFKFEKGNIVSHGVWE